MHVCAKEGQKRVAPLELTQPRSSESTVLVALSLQPLIYLL